MSAPVVVKCLNGEYINVSLVYRWFITENVTEKGFDIKASIHGPQNPYVVARCTEPQEAHTMLTRLLGTVAVIVIPELPVTIPDLPVTGERGAVEP
jgi:hypothetical protein